jgi:hypothetical protein
MSENNAVMPPESINAAGATPAGAAAAAAAADDLAAGGEAEDGGGVAAAPEETSAAGSGNISEGREGTADGNAAVDALVAMGGGGWMQTDCAAALAAAGDNLEIACELMLGGFSATAAQQQYIGAGVEAQGVSAAAAAPAGPFTHESLGAGVWKIVEADRYGQYPFIYVIIAGGAAATRCVVIDTGCGTGNLRTFICDTINTNSLPFYVILTHVHFDHVGGAHHFSNEHDNIAMSGQVCSVKIHRTRCTHAAHECLASRTSRSKVNVCCIALVHFRRSRSQRTTS